MLSTESRIALSIGSRTAAFDSGDFYPFLIWNPMEENTPRADAAPKCLSPAAQEFEVSLKRIRPHFCERVFDARSIRRRDAFKRLSCGAGEENVPQIGSSHLMWKNRRFEMRPHPAGWLQVRASLELLWGYRCAQGTSGAPQRRLPRAPASLFSRRERRAGRQPREEQLCSVAFSLLLQPNTGAGYVKNHC